MKARGAQIPIKVVAFPTRRRHVQIHSWLAALAAAALLMTLATTTATATAAPAGAAPLRPDPAYPDYPSGYNGFAAAVTRALEKLFHTRQLQLTVISTAVPDVRHYDSGPALRQDVVNGRMLLESISASPTPPPGIWDYDWPTGRWTTTSSPSRRSDSPTVDQSAI